MVVMVTGGARSGKSTFAERYAAHLGKRGVYVATSPVFDEELSERVAMHQARREISSFPWETIEEPYDLTGKLEELAQRPDVLAGETVLLVDCLILWLSNWLVRDEQQHDLAFLLQKVSELRQVISSFPGTLLLVTNEVGYGIVPEYALGRIFRDAAGMMNQRVAEASEQVFLVTAGIPQEIKSKAFPFV
ncbi:bifunctional adenosylcobinamide kinase/adenosylcobinamide-phosphate guanylyltransferase [Brevibacillus panacihumi]|uniref:Adenosylcobinamide kinase n=1 Tax=Brevibacillus panacihumi TaxID=497735 RepID=A0A3M8CYQ2_9BACL|nr:bifunctional adenosylcobinamide kinase/adenosylcobinamide-phosphate guanylyltransferase [Brevibacillus panacihumi]RNB80843.1 bifunctional adenosylcobinamide kinase/adenosylcobinamide-phosphate guanylyltransferase [Brevibacillus panacihumi]